MSDPTQIPSLVSFSDPRIGQRIGQALASFREADEEARVIDIDGVELSLIRVKMTMTDTRTTIQIHHGTRFVSGFGVRCYNEPNDVMVTEIISGYVGDGSDGFAGLKPQNAMCPGGEIDVNYFNVEDEFSFVPFDLGCFSHLAPLIMTFAWAQDRCPTIDMVIIGQSIPADALLDKEKVQRFMGAFPSAPEPALAEKNPLGDPGWSPVPHPRGVAENMARVEIFEDVPPRSLHSLERGAPRLHPIMGTVSRRGPFALQVWVGDGSPRHVVGLRSFTASGMFKVRSIYSSYEKRTILGGSLDVDLSGFNGDDCYADLDMGIVSRERPLLLVLDNFAPADVTAMLNMVLVSINSA